MQGSSGDADTGSRLVHTVGEVEGGQAERAALKSVLSPRAKYTASGNLPCDSENPKLALCANLEGREVGGRLTREGACVYLWLTHVDV